jgi:HK97 gp10 family phage protein
MAETSTRVLGLPNLLQNLTALQQKLALSILRQSSRAAANIYLQTTRSGTYGAGRVQRTGLLQRSQGVTSRVQGDVITASVKMRSVNVASNTSIAKTFRRVHSITPGKGPSKFIAFYWRFLEFGTPSRATKAGANRGSISPRPWVAPAFNARADAAIEAYRRNTSDRLDDEARKLPTGVTS